LVPQKGL